jgi:hypothetical protein
MSAIELSLQPDLGRETVCLPILPVLLHIALASQAQTKNTISNVAFFQINVAQGNDWTIIDGKGAILRGRGAHIRGGMAHFRGGGLTSEVGS